MMKGS